MLDILRLTQQFIRQTSTSKRRYRRFRSTQTFKYFLPWIVSNLFDKTPLSDGRPWITFSAVAYLSKYLKPGMTTFEYGSGGSTIYLIRRGAVLHTVETDPVWIEAVKKQIGDVAADRWFPCLIEPENTPRSVLFDPGDPGAYCSGSSDYRGCTFRAYSEEILKFPDGYFDLILIDGRARPSCLFFARSKVKSGGLILMDNTDRAYYNRAVEMLKNGFRLLTFLAHRHM